MPDNYRDEIEDILRKKRNDKVPFPVVMHLTPNGKTMVLIRPSKYQEKIAEAFIDKLGEPEIIGHSEEHPENIWMLFPHQDLPEDLKDAAERMTTSNILSFLGFKEKEFDITVYKEKFYAYISKDQVAERAYMENTTFHCFEVRGTSSDAEAQRFDSVIASAGVQPDAGDLVVVRAGSEYCLERYPEISSDLIATVLSLCKRF